MRRIFVLSVLLAANACATLDAQTEGWLGSKDKRDALDAMPGPKLETVSSTLEKQAQVALEQGDFTRAAEFYDQLLGSKNLTDVEKQRYKIGFAESLRRAGEHDKALVAFDEILKEEPDNLDAQENRALTLMALGKSTDAGRAFADIMKKDPKRWRTLNALGILFVTKTWCPRPTPISPKHWYKARITRRC